MGLNEQLALYTAFLALFTLVLAVSTVALWWETKASRLQQAKQALETRQLVRANVAIDSGSVVHAGVDGGQPGFGIQVVLKNFGTSPAMSLRTWFDKPVIDVPEALPFQARDPHFVFGASSQLPPGSVVHTAVYGLWKEGELDQVKAGKKAIFGWGAAEYTDIFGEARVFYFRLRISGEQAQSNGWALTPHPLGYEST